MKQKLIELLTLKAQGRENAKTNAWLAAELKTDSRTVREMIYEIIDKKEAFIGSWQDSEKGGYFIIRNDEDFEISSRLIQSQLEKHSHRLKCLREMKESEMPSVGQTQGRLFIQQAKELLK